MKNKLDRLAQSVPARQNQQYLYSDKSVRLPGEYSVNIRNEQNVKRNGTGLSGQPETK